MSTRPIPYARLLAPCAGWCGAAVLAALAAAQLARQPPPLAALGAVAVLLAALALALARYELPVALGLLLLGVARVEPSPSDGLLALAIAVAVASGRIELRRVPGVLLAALGLLLALTVLSAVEAVDPGEALRYLLITAYLLAFAAWLVAYAWTPARLRLVVGAYVAGAAACAAVTVSALLVPNAATGALVGDGRAQGLFKDPNVFGPFLVPAALVLLEEVLHPGLLRLRRRTALALLLVVMLGVVLSYSRAAWLNLGVAVAVMVVVLALRSGGARAATRAAVVVLAAAAVAGGAIVVGGSTEFLRERAGSHAYDAERFDAQRVGIAMSERHPLGIGPGQFELRAPIASHSIYVRVLAEQGAGGLIVLGGLLAGTLALALAGALARRRALGVGTAALLAAWCGLLVNSAFVDTLHWRHLWLVAALIWATALRAPPRAGA
jgi:O-antigen ligase